jgi:hypothetical protein
MKKTAALSILVVAVLLSVAVIAVAQQPAKIPRIGYLVGSFVSSARYEAFPAGTARARVCGRKKYYHRMAS